MTPIDWQGSWVLVTGASAGMGRQFAYALAKRGAQLVLCSRNEQRLRALADELGTPCQVIAADLETHAGIDQLLSRVDQLGIEIDHVINNAGMGGAGPFASQDPEHHVRMTELNCVAALRITRHFLPRMVERRTGGVLQVVSTAGFQPVPFMATYGATKAYLLHLSIALSEELEGTGVRMTALCPGPVPTEFQERAGYQLTGLQEKNQMSAEQVVEKGLRAYSRGQWVYTPGVTNSIQTFAQRFFSRKFVTKASAMVMRRSGRDRV